MKAYDVPGWTTERDLQILREWSTKVPENGVIVEIGSLFGRSAIAFAEGASLLTKIYCIDFFNDPYTYKDSQYIPSGSNDNFWKVGTTYDRKEEFLKNTKEYANIIPLILERPKKFYHYQGELIDLLFLDGAHKNPDDYMNLLYFRKFLKPNAIICGHDYHPSWPDVVRNVGILEKLYNTTVILYDDTTLWEIRT